MVPPIWLDEFGRCRPTRPCQQCGAEVPELRLRVEDVRRSGWQPFMLGQRVTWCGHTLEIVPIPGRDGWCQIVPVLGEVS